MSSPKPLTIRQYGDPCLRKKSSTVKEVSTSERMLIQAMIATMQEAKGVGLAAPQVGINQRIFIADIGEGPVAFINPRIVAKEGTAVMEEGCLSIPDVTVSVKRPEKIRVKFTDFSGKEVEHSFGEMMARVIQHENDHLNGKLIVDYAGIVEKRKLKEKLREIAGKNE